MNMLTHAAFITCCLIGFAVAQDRDLLSGNLPPRTALLSKEVAVQKLVTFGLDNVQNLRMEDNRWLASAMSGGQRIDVELDALTGFVRERGQGAPLRIPQPSGVAVMRDHTLKVERAEIARVQMVIEPFVPDRPTAIRPLGDRPVSERPPIAPPRQPEPPGR